MLRRLFGEPKRVDAGPLLEVECSIDAYLARVKQGEKSGQLPAPAAHRLSIWAKGFVAALDELEQSLYCAKKYAERIHNRYEEKMEEEERDDYRRHLYFYKNGMIRTFSILDKLGVFLDERLQLKTSAIKPRFSYYTVLRHMFERKVEPELQKQLYDTKLAYKEPMNRLRRQRNMEIHAMNAELLDDMRHAHTAGLSCIRIEDYRHNTEDLNEGYLMVCRTLSSVFAYLARHRL